LQNRRRLENPNYVQPINNEIQCGVLPDLETNQHWIFNFVYPQGLSTGEFLDRVNEYNHKIQEHRPDIDILYLYMRRIEEIRNAPTRTKNLEECRVKYLLGEYTEKEFSAAIYRAERVNQRIRTRDEILQTFRVTCIDYINTLSVKSQSINVVLNELKTIKDFCNKAFEEEFTIFGKTLYPYISMTRGHTMIKDNNETDENILNNIHMVNGKKKI
jgi:hypothetical protein